MAMCQETVFHGRSKGKERLEVQDSSDSGESEINWQLEALRLSDDNSDQDDTHEPGFDSIPIYYDDNDNFNDGTAAEENNVAGPSSAPQQIQSSLLMPATPQRASTIHPEPQLAQLYKQQSRAPKKKVSHSSTYHDDTLLPLPPPATPIKSTLSIALDSDFLSDASHNAPKKARARKGKQRQIIDSDEESIVVVAQYSKRSDPPPIAALNVSWVPPTDDDDEERGRIGKL
jgi:hypothetical protein